MNKNMSRAIINLLTEEERKFYDKEIDDIKWDLRNIQCLLDYLSNNEDRDVISGIYQYLEEKFDIKSEVIDEEILIELIKIHTNNFSDEIKKTHDAINIVEIYAENLCLSEGADDFICAYLEKILEFSKRINVFSDFVMNFCAIQYIRKKTPIGVIKQIVESNGIDYKLSNFTEIIDVQIEFNIILQKVKSFIFAYDNKDYTDDIKISLYDAKTMAEYFVEYGMNTVSKDLLELLRISYCKIEAYDFLINFMSMYAAICDSVMIKSKYALSLDYYIKEFFFHCIKPIADNLNVENKNIYKDLCDSYEIYRRTIDDTKEIFSDENKKSLHSLFEKTICQFNYKKFVFWYSKILGEINKIINA